MEKNTITEKRQRLIEEFFKQKLMDKSLKNEINLREVLSKKLTSFLFDASWCIAGKSFIKDQLVAIYNEAKKQDLNFEIVFVSLDLKRECANDIYLKEHADWLLWPNDHNMTNKLIEFLQVKYLPSLIVVTANFEKITSVGRRELNENGLEAVVNWAYFWRQNNIKK